MDNSYEFKPFDKIARLKRELVITEKLDGTNAQVMITLDEPVGDIEHFLVGRQLSEVGMMYMLAGSRKRWIAPEGQIMHMEEPVKGTDNFGFAGWVRDNADDLFSMGEGRHYGEWYGKGIQRGYGIDNKLFALFNVARWGAHNPNTPACVQVVPKFVDGTAPDEAMELLSSRGSLVADFKDPEGIVVWHSASRTLYKQTFAMDGGKWREEVEYDV